MEIVTLFLLPGMALGIMAALSPGPLMALIVSETMRHGFGGGIRVSIAPLLTDVPFILGALVVAKGIESSSLLLASVSFIGGFFLACLGYSNITIKKDSFLSAQSEAPKSLQKGVLVNLLNPHLYIYWFSIAPPIFAGGTLIENSLFAGSLLLSSVLTMISLSIGVHTIRMHVFDYAHCVLRFLGICLLIFSVTLFSDGLSFFLEL